MPEVLTPMSDVFADDTAIISRRELKAFMQRSNRPGLIHLALWMLLLSITSALIWLITGNPWLIVPAMFLHGIVVVHHFALQHEYRHLRGQRRFLIDQVTQRLAGNAQLRSRRCHAQLECNQKMLPNKFVVVVLGYSSIKKKRHHRTRLAIR